MVISDHDMKNVDRQLANFAQNLAPLACYSYLVILSWWHGGCPRVKREVSSPLLPGKQLTPGGGGAAPTAWRTRMQGQAPPSSGHVTSTAGFRHSGEPD